MRLAATVIVNEDIVTCRAERKKIESEPTNKRTTSDNGEKLQVKRLEVAASLTDTQKLRSARGRQGCSNSDQEKRRYNR